jgi:hypothetical protein
MCAFLYSKEKKLREAAKKGDRKEVERILRAGKVDVDRQDKNG